MVVNASHEAAEPLRDCISERECLAGRVTDQLRRQGYYVTHIASGACQTLIDIQWAALLAGRALGRRTRTYASAVGKRRPDDITVVVALVQRAAPGTREAVVAATIADLLGANGAGAA
jgi:hypothetical protein